MRLSIVMDQESWKVDLDEDEEHHELEKLIDSTRTGATVQGVFVSSDGVNPAVVAAIASKALSLLVCVDLKLCTGLACLVKLCGNTRLLTAYHNLFEPGKRFFGGKLFHLLTGARYLLPHDQRDVPEPRFRQIEPGHFKYFDCFVSDLHIPFPAAWVFDEARSEVRVGDSVGLVSYRHGQLTRSRISNLSAEDYEALVASLPTIYGLSRQICVLTGKVMAVGTETFTHSINTYRGCSGGAIVLLDGPDAGKCVGIHTGGVPGSSCNAAIRISAVSDREAPRPTAEPPQKRPRHTKLLAHYQGVLEVLDK